MKKAVGSNQYQTRLVPDDAAKRQRKAREAMPSRPRPVTKSSWAKAADDDKYERVVDLSDDLVRRSEASLRLIGF